MKSVVPLLSKAFAPETWATWAAFVVGVGVLYIYWRTLNAVEVSAEAAKRSSEIVINAERAWIMAEIAPQPGAGWVIHSTNQDSVESVGLNVLCKCRNDGKSMAWITEKWAAARTFDTVPPHPDFSDKEKIFQHAVQPIAAGTQDVGYRLWLIAPGSHTGRKPILLYGYIKYRTIFDGRDGETRFGYIVTPMNNLDRLPPEYPEYNANT
jgi:hypothetical protein